MSISSLQIALPFRADLVIIWLAAALSACSGGGDNGNSNVPDTSTLYRAPSLNFSANVSEIGVSEDFTLTWSSTDTKTCTASGDWSGVKALQGTQTIREDEAGSKSYTLACSGDGGTIDASVVVSVIASSSPEISFTPFSLSTWSEHSALVDLVVSDDKGIADGPNVTCDYNGIFSDNIFTAPLTSHAITVTCTAEVTDTEGNISTATLEVDVQVPQAKAFDTWHGTVTPSFEKASPQSYEQFANSPNLNITGGPAGLNHTPTDAPGAGKFVFNRVFRMQKHGLGHGEQFGIYSSWLHSFGANSIEGGLWVNPGAAGPDYYPTLHLASLGDGYHICNDVQMGSGLYGVYIGDRWLNMVQISNQVLFIPGSNIAFDMLQNPHQLDNGIWAGWGWSYLNLAHPRDYKFWMSFVETYDYQGPINGYIPEHFNWISPDTVASGAYAQAQQDYGSDYGTFATRGNNANGVFGNEYYVEGTLRIEDDLFYVPLPKFPIEKAREYIIAHPQNISQNDMEIYSSGIRSNSLSDTLIPTRNLTFASLYDTSHSRIKICEQINGQEYRYYCSCSATVRHFVGFA